MLKSIIMLTLMALIFNSNIYAEDKKIDLDIKTGTSVREDNGEQRVEQKFSIKLKVKLGGGFEVVSVTRAGNKYDQGHATIYDTRREDRYGGLEDIYKSLAVRNLYISKTFDAGNSEVEIQAGALETDRGLSGYTALASEGWVDGIRVKAYTDFGDITFTAGSIDDLKSTGFYDRDIAVNYYEIKMERKVLENFLVEVGAEVYDGENFLKYASKYQVNLAVERAFDILTEALYNVDTEDLKASIGVKSDLLELITGKESGFIVEIRHSYMSEEMGERGNDKMTGGFSTFAGHYGTIKISKTLTKNKKVAWYIRFKHDYDENYRIESGLKFDLY